MARPMATPIGVMAASSFMPRLRQHSCLEAYALGDLAKSQTILYTKAQAKGILLALVLAFAAASN